MKFIYPAIFSKTTEGTFEAVSRTWNAARQPARHLTTALKMQIRLPMTGSMSN